MQCVLNDGGWRRKKFWWYAGGSRYSIGWATTKTPSLYIWPDEWPPFRTGTGRVDSNVAAKGLGCGCPLRFERMLGKLRSGVGFACVCAISSSFS